MKIPTLNPLAILREATKDRPKLAFVWGIVAVLAAFAIGLSLVQLFADSPADAAIWGTVALVALLLFAWAGLVVRGMGSESNSRLFQTLGAAVAVFATLLLGASAVLILSSFAFGTPICGSRPCTADEYCGGDATTGRRCVRKDSPTEGTFIVHVEGCDAEPETGSECPGVVDAQVTVLFLPSTEKEDDKTDDQGIAKVRIPPEALGNEGAKITVEANGYQKKESTVGKEVVDGAQQTVRLAPDLFTQAIRFETDDGTKVSGELTIYFPGNPTPYDVKDSTATLVIRDIEWGNTRFEVEIEGYEVSSPTTLRLTGDVETIRLRRKSTPDDKTPRVCLFGPHGFPDGDPLDSPPENSVCTTEDKSVPGCDIVKICRTRP